MEYNRPTASSETVCDRDESLACMRIDRAIKRANFYKTKFGLLSVLHKEERSAESVHIAMNSMLKSEKEIL